MPTGPLVSFVIPAYNEELLLGRTLEAIELAGRSLDVPYEVVVADDASTDGTAALAESRGARIVPCQNRQIAATRNAGARASSGAMMIFVDADTVVSPEAVRGAVEAMRAGAAGGGSSIRFDGRVPLFGRILLASLMPLYHLFGLASGCFLFCTREVFDAIGGFDEKLFAAEELGMSRALGRQGRFVMLREPIITSGRKIRTYRARELIGLLARLGVKREAGVSERTADLDAWYGERRPDPDSPR